MSQSDTMVSTRFFLLSGSITRFFLLLIVVLLVMTGVMVQSAVNTWLKDKSYQIVDTIHATHKRVDTWRYVTWQIYDNIAATTSSLGADGPQETRLRRDTYYLEKPRRKTEALIFDSYDSSTLEMTQRTSTHLDTLWGVENVPWSIYYLNGQDNNLTLISTLPLKDLTSGFKESMIGNIVDSRRVGMPQQANALDEHESFSSLRCLAWQSGYYFTLRTTFNQPGYLAMVVAFDLPVNDLIPPGMSLDSSRLESDATLTTGYLNEKEPPDGVSINFNNSKTEVSSALNSTDMRLVWQVPFGSLLPGTLQNISLPLLLNIALLALTLLSCTTFRHLPARSAQVAPNLVTNNEPRVLRVINEEIASLLPLGLLVHDQEANCTVINNKTVDYPLPHLNLQDTINIAEQHQGVIQAIINNELYEIRLFRSQISPRMQIFIIRDRDREVLVNKKLKQAQRPYERNQQTRAAFIQNIGSTLKDLAKTPAANAAAFNIPDSQKLANQVDVLVRVMDEIQPANLLENDAWKGESTLFSVQASIDDVVPEILPTIRRKGLQLLIKNRSSVHDERRGDRDALRRILLLLIQYTVTITQIDKITLEVDQDESEAERLIFRILDTGEGVTLNEVDNLHFPFISDTQGDRYGKINPLTFRLCDRLARRLGGHLSIRAQEELGTRYIVHVKTPLYGQRADNEECLLDDVCVMADVISNSVWSIVLRQLKNQGVIYITLGEWLNSQEYDLFLTDNLSNLIASGLLLSDDESGVRKIDPDQLRINFNMSNTMQEAVFELIEEQLVQKELQELPLGGNENAELRASGYYALFVDTVPDDVKRLYTEAATSDFTALAQAAHHLKGAFAMLNLVSGKQLCEALEHLIQEKDALGIEKYISDIDVYVKSLLQQGSPIHGHYERNYCR